MARGRVLRIKYENRDIGFLDAGLEEDSCAGRCWQLRVKSPENLAEFRDSLALARSIALSLYAADGKWYTGQALVAFVSEDHLFPFVTLTGQGPLRAA
jgi:hypothetical protein